MRVSETAAMETETGGNDEIGLPIAAHRNIWRKPFGRYTD